MANAIKLSNSREHDFADVTVVEARWIVPVVPEKIWHENSSMIIRNGKIIDILPIAEANKKYPNPRKRYDLQDEYCLIPGLVNVHCHTPMGLLRGLADDVQLLDWLMHYMWPAEGKFVSQEFVRVGSALTITELLRCGVTCVNDMYFFPDVTAKLINNCGMRATVGAPIIHFPTAWASNIDEYFDKGKKLIEEYKNHPRVTTIFAPHAPYTVDDPTFRKIKEVSEQYNTKIHCHIHETMKEIEDHVKSPDHNGVRPLERLDKLGLLNERLIAVHMTHLTKEEIKVIFS